MDNKEFDQILKARFTNETLQEQDDGWQKLSAMLPAAPQKRRTLIYWKIAASVLLVLGLGLGFSVLFQKQNEIVRPTEITGNQKNIRNTPGASHLPTEDAQPNNNQVSALTSTLSFRSQKNIAGNNTTNASTTLPDSHHAKNKSDIATAMPQPEDNIIIRQPVPGANSKTEQDSPVTDRQDQVAEAAAQKPVPATSTGSLENTFNPMAGTAATKHRTTAIAFGGGMNYGVLNAGYNMNISARHALSKHVFVEGSIAFLYNSQAEKSSFYAAQNFSPTRPAPGQVSASHTTNPAASNFYYLSVNPTMGYQINKIIALSAGPDLQQRIAALGQDGTSIYTPGLDPRIIPQLDFGFTGKAAFFISPKIETGILFRNSLNNLLKKPDLHPYLNRRYIQVQLNYNFLLSK